MMRDVNDKFITSRVGWSMKKDIFNIIFCINIIYEVEFILNYYSLHVKKKVIIF